MSTISNVLTFLKLSHTFHNLNQGRIQNFSEEGAPISGGLPNILIIFSEKPYDKKEILVRRGRGGAGCAP